MCADAHRSAITLGGGGALAPCRSRGLNCVNQYRNRFSVLRCFFGRLLKSCNILQGNVQTTVADPAGWASTVISIWFLGGLVIFILGVIGLYIGRVFDEVKRRPLYLVSETTDDHKT